MKETQVEGVVDDETALADRLTHVRQTRDDIVDIALNSAKNQNCRNALGEEADKYIRTHKANAQAFAHALDRLLEFITKQESVKENTEAVLNVSRILFYAHEINAFRVPSEFQAKLAKQIGAAENRPHSKDDNFKRTRIAWAAELAFKKRKEPGNRDHTVSRIAELIAPEFNARCCEAGQKKASLTTIRRDYLGSDTARFLMERFGEDEAETDAAK